MRTLAVIPARAGSKGIPGKNKRLFCGKPLVAWAIEVGKRTCDRVLVSSDDPEVLHIAGEYWAEITERPAELARDDTPMLDVLVHALACEAQPVDVVVLLQPTSPLRTDAHVKQALWVLKLRPRVDSVVSVVEIPPHQSPDFAMLIAHDEKILRPFIPGILPTRRQDCRPAYYRDGTVYAVRASLIRRHELYGRAAPLLIPTSESCTIDTEEDWAKAEEAWRKCHA